MNNKNEEDDCNEEEEIEEGDEVGDGDDNYITNIGDSNNNGFIFGNKNSDNENLELIEQIKYFNKEVEKLEKENNETKKKIQEYDEEYKSLKEELKFINNIHNIKSAVKNNSTSHKSVKFNVKGYKK